MSCRAARPLHSSVLAPLRRQHPVHAARHPPLAPSRLVVRSGGAEADQLQQTAQDGASNDSGRPKPQRVGPCSNPNCGSPTTSGQWYLAPEGSGVAGAVCARCYKYNRLKGLLPLSPVQPKLHGPCSNPACGATETTGNWNSAPEGSGVAGAVCDRCYKYNRRKGALPVWRILPKLHGPCSNPACGATESTKSWHSAPEGSGVAGAVCSRCYHYNRLKGVLPVSPKRAKLHGPCCNSACGATETSFGWYSAPKGSGVAGAVCSRCYQYNRLKGVLPMFPPLVYRTKLHDS